MTYRVHSRAKVTPEDIRLIRALLEEKARIKKALDELTFEKIGQKFDLSGETVRQIGSGRSWGALR